MNQPATRTAALLLGVLATAACGDAPAADTSLRSDSAGISIVLYDGAERAPAFSLEEDFRLGGSETVPEQSFYQVAPGLVDVDQQGRIYVLESSAHRVVVFDRDGNFIRAVGRQGGGPGELGFPGGIAVAPDGVLGIADFSRRGFVRFDADGQLLETEPFPQSFFGGRFRFTGDGIATVRQEAGGEVLFRAGPGGAQTIAFMPGAETKPIRLESCGIGLSGMPALFTPTLRWGAGGERVAIATSDAYDIAVFDNGREVMRVRRAVLPEPATLEDALEELGEGMKVQVQNAMHTCDPREVAEKQGIAPTMPAIGSIAVAPDGMIWVRRGGPMPRPRAVDVFEGDGEYLGTLPEGAPFPVAFLPDGRIAAAHTDELEVTRLVVYRLEGR
jgi:hypothetical protein